MGSNLILQWLQKYVIAKAGKSDNWAILKEVMVCDMSESYCWFTVYTTIYVREAASGKSLSQL